MPYFFPPVAPGFLLLFAGFVVLTVVGGQVVRTVLKELLPLLRSLVQERQTSASSSSSSELMAQLRVMESRLSRLEGEHRELKEASEFLQKLLDARVEAPDMPVLPKVR